MYHWRSLVPLLFPMWKLCESFVDAFSTFRRHRQQNRLGRWLLYQLMRLTAYKLSERMSYRICDPMSKVAWPVFAIRVLVSCFASNVIYFLVEYAYCLLLITTFEDLLLYAFVLYFVFPAASFVIMAFYALRSIILQLETTLDEFFHAPMILPPSRYWELVTSLRSSDNGYGASYFYAVQMGDYSLLDDPFWPNHASVVCVVEIRRRNWTWDRISIWRVSLLNGGKNKLHEFSNAHRGCDDDSLLDRATCYQSDGVIFVNLFTFEDDDLLFVYDTRHAVSGAHRVRKRHGLEKRMFSISCVHRFFNADCSVAGWRIRCLEYSLTRCYCHFGDDHKFRPCLQNVVFDLLGDRSQLISHEEIVFGRCWNLGHSNRGRFVRTSRGSVGRYEEDAATADGPTLLYDRSNGEYSYFPNFYALLRSDRPFAIYSNLPSPIGSLRPGDEYGNLSPAILNSRECVECFENGAVFRAEIAPPTLKYLAAKALFHARPNLRSEMRAEEFRELTGIGGMEGHFDR